MNSYFSHDSNARNDEKIIAVRMKHGMEGYGVYFAILERMRDEKEYKCVKDYNMIAFDLRVDAALVKSVAENFGLFVFTDNGKYFYSESFLKRMEQKDKVSEKRSGAAKSKWQSDVPDDTVKRSERLANARKISTHTQEEWEEMKKFFGHCVICGKADYEVKIVKDHIIPIYQGGSDGIDNLQPLCSSCNSRKGADNHDYRVDYCLQNACKMPAKWQKMPASKVKESKVKEEEVTGVTSLSGGKPPDLPQPPHSHEEVIDFKKLVEWFNAETKGVFGLVKYPLGEKRKASIRARIRERGREQLAEMVKKAAQSDFLRGQNSRGWTATLDWLVKPTNFEKVISGNYDNSRSNASAAHCGGGNSEIDEDFARHIAAGIARARTGQEHR